MEIQGKIILALPEVQGTSAAGRQWKKREYVLETIETYPRKIFFDFFGERADQYPLQVGQVIKLSFDIESREYNGRWYTHIRGWQAQAVADGAPAAAPAPTAAPAGYPPAGYGAPATPAAVPPPPAITPQEPTDDLPF